MNEKITVKIDDQTKILRLERKQKLQFPCLDQKDFLVLTDFFAQNEFVQPLVPFLPSYQRSRSTIAEKLLMHPN